ncbi:MAG: hypothetical protein VKN72_03735 [Nostocales cyanobacterium 94392]|nr:hypothetical protein [Nostocales cyanobacterium 94392]
MIIINVFFAQFDTNSLVENGSMITQNIATNWDKQWIDLLQTNTNNNIYGALTRLGIFFAVGTLLLFVAQWLRDVLENEYSRPISSLIMPFIIVLLLANPGNGTPLSNLTLGTRNFLNTINQQVITTTNNNQIYQQAVNLSVAEDVVGALLRPCQSLMGELQNQCLTKSKEKIDPLWANYRNQYGNQPWINRLETQVNQIIFNSYPVSEVEFNSLLGSNTQINFKNLLISSQFAFQNLIEATFLLIAALGPIALGASLLPVTVKPIFVWLTGFFAIAIAKLSFNIIILTTATVVVDTSSQNITSNLDLTWFLICIGILAPILSLVTAAVGGIATFNAMNNS